jgi:hypothetical protein
MTPNQLVLLIIVMIIAFVWLATRSPLVGGSIIASAGTNRRVPRAAVWPLQPIHLLYGARTPYVVAQIRPRRNRLEVSSIAEIARLFSLLSVPDNMIKGDGCSEPRFR